MIIDQIKVNQRAYNEALYEINMGIYKEMYQLIYEPVTLDDIYHNLEVTRRRLHREIDFKFLEAKAIRNMFHLFETTGIILQERNKSFIPMLSVEGL